MASGGVDKIVRIWQLTLDAEGKAWFSFLSNLRRHTATVNVVRFSKNGELLATAGDDTAIILWKLSDVPTPTNNIFVDDDAEEDKESWVCHKTLRGHLGDVADLCWSKDNRYLVSGSVDNSAIVWDVLKDVKVAIFNEHKSYVQGVAFDPLGNYVATLSADRSLRLYNLSSKCCVNNVNKMALPSHLTLGSSEATGQQDSKPKSFRIFHDDSLRSFFRRLEFSPDGQLLMAPAGCLELGDGKIINSSYIFARGAFSKPAVYLPSVEKSTTVVRVNPQLYELRPAEGTDKDTGSDPQKVWDKHKSLFCLPYRVVFAVATEDSVILYDTQQTMPVALLKNIHYHQISDLSWTSDGKALIVSSTDGFCTIATFEDGELGVPYKEPVTEKISSSPANKTVLDSAVDTDMEKTPEKLSLPFAQYSTPKSAVKNHQEVSPSSSNCTKPPKVVQCEQTPKTSQTDEKTILKSNPESNTKSDSAKKPDLTSSVQAMRIEESGANCLTEDRPETTEKDVPKKRRVQITTLFTKKSE
ncbi:chromatin assembly factor 1 subunit B-like isoform X2 [Physella acuta]|uniref:chromatin assembly factor 1 subunit B-like isoform X2 n=1 Tax=Physella acuta TaxID=109671 RepID=UPI0027DCB5DE|nr:chromatin assembly factor 1 subunit B-like isoform X2 [Physella acuta]